MSSTQTLRLFYEFASYILQYGYSWINYMVNAQNVAAPCAWSAKYHYKETDYFNNDSRDKVLPSTTVKAIFRGDEGFNTPSQNIFISLN